MQRLEHAAQAHAAGQVHIAAHLGAAADGGPGVDHGPFTDPGADVHIAGHQDGAFRDKAAAPCHSRRHYAHPSGAHFSLAEVGELGLYFVKKAEIAGAHQDVVFQAKAQQNGFLDPLVRGPHAHALTGGHAQHTFVELADDLLNSVQHFGRC